MRVLLCTPETGLFCLAFAAAVIRVPFLAPKTLAHATGKATVSLLIMGRLTPLVLIAKEDAVPEDSLLSLLSKPRMKGGQLFD